MKRLSVAKMCNVEKLHVAMPVYYIMFLDADAINMARDTIGLRLIAMEDDGQKIPEPSTYKAAIKMAKEDAD